jgi:hypothetical protein
MGLAGTWTFNGMATDNNCGGPAPPTTMPVNLQITFWVDGCSWRTSWPPFALADEFPGTLDDTTAIISYGRGSLSFGGTICERLSGALTYAFHTEQRCTGGGATTHNISTSGLLTR